MRGWITLLDITDEFIKKSFHTLPWGMHMLSWRYNGKKDVFVLKGLLQRAGVYDTVNIHPLDVFEGMIYPEDYGIGINRSNIFWTKE